MGILPANKKGHVTFMTWPLLSYKTITYLATVAGAAGAGAACGAGA